MKVITLCLYKRYEYSKRTLEYLSRCIGFSSYHLFIHVEPNVQQVINLAHEFSHEKKYVVINSHRLGCTENTLRTLSHGFEHSNYVIHVEDDILLAPDALIWFEWANDAFKSDLNVFSIAGYSRRVVQPHQYYTYIRKNWFTPWGWATWKNRFQEFETILRNKVNQNPRCSWDVLTNHQIRGNRVQVEPLLGRTQNIGAKDGTYCPGPEWHRNHQYNEFWSGMPGLELNQHCQDFSFED